MERMELDHRTLSRIQRLIVANFAGRDELYAAADSLSDMAQQKVCQRLAEHLADHAVELQQILIAGGIDPAEPVDVDLITKKLFEFAQTHRNDKSVLEIASAAEHDLVTEYDEAIESSQGSTTDNVLRRQRDDVEFGEQVLDGMKRQQRE